MKKIIVLSVSVIISMITAGCNISVSIPEAGTGTTTDTANEAPASESKEQIQNPEESESAVKEAAVEEKDTADAHFIQYLLGNETDKTGETFWAVGDEEVEYALFDINDDGKNELLIREFGWIPDIIICKDGKIEFAGANNVGSSGLAMINTKNQFVSGDTTHVSREQYWISELGKDGVMKYPLYFGKMWDDWAKTEGTTDYLKCEDPGTDDFSTDDCIEISEAEFEELVHEYVEENTDIEWKKISDIDGALQSPAGTAEKSGVEKTDINDVLAAYDSFMQETFDSKDGDVSISLLYINDDDIPEAIIQQDGDITWYIMTYHDGKAENIGGTVVDSLYYVPKGNVFYYEWSDGEAAGTDFFKMDGIYAAMCPPEEIGESLIRDCTLFKGKFYPTASEAYNNMK